MPLMIAHILPRGCPKKIRPNEIIINKKIILIYKKKADALQEAPVFPLLQDYRLTAARINKQMTEL